jgi:hypothetical protein
MKAKLNKMTKRRNVLAGTAAAAAGVAAADPAGERVAPGTVGRQAPAVDAAGPAVLRPGGDRAVQGAHPGHPARAALIASRWKSAGRVATRAPAA